MNITDNICNLDKSGIYKITNIFTNKVYIGSSYNLYKRYKQHLSILRSNKHFNCHLQFSFNKYGEENFIFEKEEYCDESLLLDREQYYLDLYKSYNKELGYNISKRADAVLTENTIVPVCQYGLGGKFIKVWDSIKDFAGDNDTARVGISANIRGINKTALGYRWTYYNKDNFVYDLGKIKYDYKAPNHSIEGKKRTQESKYKVIKQYDKQGNFIKEWPSIVSASKTLNIGHGDLSVCCSGKQKSAGGYQWCYKGNEGSIKKYNKKVKGKKIVQYDLEGNFIKIWDRASDAEKELKLKTSIRTYLGKGLNKVGGYLWYKYDSKKFKRKLKPYKNPREKEIVQFDLEGNFIKRWRSIREASDFYNIHESNIGQCLSGRCNTSNGFKWKFYEDWKKEKELINE